MNNNEEMTVDNWRIHPLVPPDNILGRVVMPGDTTERNFTSGFVVNA